MFVYARCLSLIVTWCKLSRITSQLRSPTRRPLLVGSLKSIVFVRVCVWIVARCITSINATASATAKIPSLLILSDRLHQGENWKSFRRKWKFYELAAGIHKKAQEVRVASLLNVIGKERNEHIRTFQWGNSLDALKIDKVLEKTRSVVFL